MSRVEENANLHLPSGLRTDKEIWMAQAKFLEDISRSLAVIADELHTEEVEKSCHNCRSWTMDISNPERKCGECYMLDEWEESDGR